MKIDALVLSSSLATRFLVAHLQMEALKGCRTVGLLKKTLGSLPSGLDGMYKLTLERIEAQSAEDARIGKLALMWVSRAKRRFTVRQLREAVATTYDVGSFEAGTFSEEDMPRMDLILSATGGLLMVEDNGEVRLVRELYLRSSRRGYLLNVCQTTLHKTSCSVSRRHRSANTRR